jgi:hypothetical protein
LQGGVDGSALVGDTQRGKVDVVIRVSIMLDDAPPSSGSERPPLVFADHPALDAAIASGRVLERDLSDAERSLLRAVSKSLPEEIVGVVDVIASKGMFQLAWKRIP